MVLASLPIIPGAEKPRPLLFRHRKGRIPLDECAARIRYLAGGGPKRPEPPAMM